MSERNGKQIKTIPYSQYAPKENYRNFINYFASKVINDQQTICSHLQCDFKYSRIHCIFNPAIMWQATLTTNNALSALTTIRQSVEAFYMKTPFAGIVNDVSHHIGCELPSSGVRL